MSPRSSPLRFAFAVCWVMASSFTALAAARQDSPISDRPLVYAADVDALIHPVSAEFIAQTIERANADEAELVILTLQTPGGLVDSTRAINTSIIESETPVVVYVGPSGTRATSAGFLITIAADVAVMAPGTHIGAAHPVSGTGASMDEAVAEKAVSDVAAYARSLANQRNRNVELSERAVTESESFTEREALDAEPALIDFVATDFDDLLSQLDGREVQRWDGTITVLETSDAIVELVTMNWRQRFLSAIAHPQVSVLLFSLGTLGLTIELWNPGGIIPGVVGGVCLLLAFFAFQVLPINYVGLLLILFGLVLLAAEAMTPTFGFLAVGGILSMVLGAVMLIDSQVQELQLGWPFLLSSMLALGAITTILARLGISAQRKQPVTGRAGMINALGEVLSSIDAGGSGRVAAHGEIWTATADEDVAVGVQVQIVSIDGLKLTVRQLTARSSGGTHACQ